MLARMSGESFDWLKWNAGTMVELLGVNCRYEDIKNKAAVLRRYAIGYCPGESLVCRPKHNCVGVMFLKEDTEFWTHLTAKEFLEVFKNE